MIPTTVIAGDTMSFDETFNEYPSTDWALTAYLVGPSLINAVAVPNVDASFTVTLSAARTSTLKPGTYTMTLRASAGEIVRTVSSTTFVLLPNPEYANARVNVAERIIELIDAALQGQLSDGDALEAFSIAGRSFNNISRLELLDERGRWINELNALRRTRTGQSSLKTHRLIVGR